jgi:DNA-binding transcriptional regulator/RsmH inhibitor MraZ
MLANDQELYKNGKINTDHLLIGNGFSIGIWSVFNYTSLYERQKGSLEIKDKMLFEELRTTNIEKSCMLLPNKINLC